MATPTSSDDLGTRILDAALELFREYGLRRTTVEDVRRLANVNRVTIYRLFDDRTGLTMATIAREVNRGVGELAAAVADIERAEDRVVEAMVLGGRLVREDPLFARMLHSEPEALALALTIDGGAVVTALSGVIVSLLGMPAGDQDAVDDAHGLCEIIARVGISFALSREGHLKPETDDDVRAMARKYVAPMVTAVIARSGKRGRQAE